MRRCVDLYEPLLRQKVAFSINFTNFTEFMVSRYLVTGIISISNHDDFCHFAVLTLSE